MNLSFPSYSLLSLRVLLSVLVARLPLLLPSSSRQTVLIVLLPSLLLLHPRRVLAACRAGGFTVMHTQSMH